MFNTAANVPSAEIESRIARFQQARDEEDNYEQNSKV